MFSFGRTKCVRANVHVCVVRCRCVRVCLCVWAWLCVWLCVCVGWDWIRWNWGLWGVAVCFSVGVLSTLPSAKSLPMPLWFYLLYDFLVNFIFLMCNSHQPHHANKGKCVWKKNNNKISCLHWSPPLNKTPQVSYNWMLFLKYFLQRWRRISLLPPRLPLLCIGGSSIQDMMCLVRLELNSISLFKRKEHKMTFQHLTGFKCFSENTETLSCVIGQLNPLQRWRCRLWRINW